MFFVVKPQQIVLAVVTLLILAPSQFLMGQTDPTRLLDGVRSRMESMPNCSLTLVASGTWGDIQPDTRFDVRYQAGRVLISRSAEKTTMLTDGEAIYYNPNSCTIKDPKDSGIGFLVDPRVLGLTCGYWASVDLDMALRKDNRREIKMVGTEVLRGTKCFKVQTVDNWNEVKTFWVDPYNRFRVLRCQHETPGGTVAITESEYAQDTDFFPTEIKTEKRTAKGQIQYTLDLRIEDVNLKPEPCKFDLSSLGMESGTPVADIRIKERIGYWDGRRLQALSHTAPTKEPERSTIPWGWMIATAVGIGAFFMIAKSRNG